MRYLGSENLWKLGASSSTRLGYLHPSCGKYCPYLQLVLFTNAVISQYTALSAAIPTTSSLLPTPVPILQLPFPSHPKVMMDRHSGMTSVLVSQEGTDSGVQYSPQGPRRHSSSTRSTWSPNHHTSQPSRPQTQAFSMFH